jgi:hypothetical protein
LEHHKTQSGFTDFEARARLSGTRAVSQSDRDRERDFDQQRRQIHGGEKTGRLVLAVFTLEHMEQLRPTANICDVEPMSWLNKTMLPDQQSSVAAGVE